MTAPATLYVINPNSLASVTDGIDAAMQRFRELSSVSIRCLTLAEGPPGILTQSDADQVVVPLLHLIGKLETDAAGFVIACYSDPGIHSAREHTRKPVVGIGEAAMLTACTLGQRIGVIAVAARAIPRHLRYYAAMGLADRVVNERAVNLSVAESGDERRALGRMIDIGKQLRDVDGADVLLMGCAGMSALRDEMEHAIGVPVVDPCKAGAGMALARIMSQ
jgi:allantoin racemase